jgi:hypothetical protein
MLQSPKASRLRICLHFAACPSHPCIRQNVAANRDREGICNSCSSALPISDLGWAPSSLHPCVLASSGEGNVNRSCSCVDGQGRVTVFEKRGARDFGLRDAGALLRTPTIQSPTATYAEIGPSRRRSASSPDTRTRTQTPRLCWGQGSSPRRCRRRTTPSILRRS